MRKLVNLKGFNSLTNEQLKHINGGANYTCYCGFVGGEGEQFTFPVNADNIGDALWGAGKLCNGKGATCSGN